MKEINLYNEDGMAIYLDENDCRVAPDDPEAVLCVVGHQIYARTLEEAERSIILEYLWRKDRGQYDDA